jgi:chromosome segregation ATPase
MTRAESDGATIDEEALIETLSIAREIDQTVGRKKALKKDIKAQQKIFDKLSGTPAYRAVKKAREDLQLHEEQFQKDVDALEDKERQCKRDIQRLENEILLLQGAIETCSARIEIGVIYTADIPDEDESAGNDVMLDLDFGSFEDSLPPL